jgi:hypothetical protein
MGVLLFILKLLKAVGCDESIAALNEKYVRIVVLDDRFAVETEEWFA